MVDVEMGDGLWSAASSANRRCQSGDWYTVSAYRNHHHLWVKLSWLEAGDLVSRVLLSGGMFALLNGL